MEAVHADSPCSSTGAGFADMAAHASAMHGPPEGPHAALAAWAADASPFPIMDVRPESNYAQQRLRGAAHVPPDTLADHCFWLPDKTTRFGVVLPATGQLPVRDCENLAQFLATRHWTAVVWYLRDSEELWAAARQLGVYEGPEVPLATLRRRFLFKPCPLLEQEIDRIESSLAATACSSSSSSGSGGSSGSSKGEGRRGDAVGDGARPLRLRCMEPGCGSARNMAWMVVREPVIAVSQQQDGANVCSLGGHHARSGEAQNDLSNKTGTHADNDLHSSSCQPEQQQQRQQEQRVQVSWSALGLDFWYGALARTQDLFQHAGVPQEQAALWFVNIDPATGRLAPLPLHDTCRHSAGKEANTHIVLPSPTQLEEGVWDLVLCVRFLERAFFARLPTLLAPGGFVLVHTFLDMEGTRRFGRPQGERHLLQPGELAAMFGSRESGCEVVRDDVMLLDDGREVCMFVARRLPTTNTA